MKKVGYIALAIIVAALGLSIAWYVIWKVTQNGTPVKADMTEQLQQSSQTDQSISISTGQNNDIGIPLGNDNQSQADQLSSLVSDQKSAPTPDQFGQYESYAKNETALFGDIVIGSGIEVTQSSKVAVYYKGWLTNGQLFDESRLDPTKTDGSLQPFIFTMGVGQVIAGWEEGLLGTKVGGTRRIIVPPIVGYGAQGQESIPPNSVLVFDVQLLAAE